MNIFIVLLLALAAIIALLLILGLFVKRDHYVKREIMIHAPRQKVFDYIRLLKNQDHFNKGAMAGEERERTYKGTDGTVGFIYAWKGDRNAGEGEKEIMNIVEGERMEAEIRFIKPMSTSSYIIMETEALPGNQTRVSWSNSGTLKWPVNLFIPMIEKKLPKDMDISLGNLKRILEKE